MKSLAPHSLSTVSSIDPTSGEVFDTSETFSDRLIDAALDRSVAAVGTWRRSRWERRSELLHAVAAKLRGASDELAHRISREMDKPIGSGVGRELGGTIGMRAFQGLQAVAIDAGRS